jgi:hypothetical protein
LIQLAINIDPWLKNTANTLSLYEVRGFQHKHHSHSTATAFDWPLQCSLIPYSSRASFCHQLPSMRDIIGQFLICIHLSPNQVTHSEDPFPFVRSWFGPVLSPSPPPPPPLEASVPQCWAGNAIRLLRILHRATQVRSRV